MTCIKELKLDKQKYRNDAIKCTEIINLLGHKYLQVGRYEEAVTEHLEAINVCRKIKNVNVAKELEALTRRALGECYSEMGRHEEALDEQDRYLLLTLQLNDPIEIERAYTTIGRTYLLWAQDTGGHEAREYLHKSQDYFLKALKQGENLKSSGKLKGREYADVRSRLLINLGLVYENLGDYSQSQELLDEAIELTKQYYLNEDLYRCQISASAIYEKLERLEEARQLSEDALETAKILKDKLKQFDAHVSLAMVLLKLEEVNKARRCLKRAYYLKTPVLEEQDKVEQLLRIVTSIRSKLGQVSREQDPDQLIVLCDSLGDDFVEVKCYSMAIEYYHRELRFAQEAGKSNLILAKIYVSLAQTYMDDGRYREAIKNFEHESDLISDCGSIVEQAVSLMKIADCQEAMLSNLDDLETEQNCKLRADVIQTYQKAMALFDIDQLEAWWLDVNKNNLTCRREELKTLMVLLKNFHLFLTGIKESLLSDELAHHMSKFKAFIEAEEINDREGEELDTIQDEETTKDDFVISSDSEAEPEQDEEIPANFSTRLKRRTAGGEGRGGGGKVVNRLNQFGETPLHTACIAGNLAQVQRLIEQKVPLNAKDYCGWTPLHEAANHGHLEVVECLLEAGADLESFDDRSERIRPLHDACQCGNFSVIRLLLKYSANVLAVNAHQETPLECLLSWRQRTSGEMSPDDLTECLALENEMIVQMKAKGFDLDRLSQAKQKTTSNVSKRRLIHRNLVNDLLYETEPDQAETRTPDVDEPGYGQKEYKSAMAKLRGKKNDKNGKLRGQQQAALIEEDVVRDDWLIDDLKKSKTFSKKRDLIDFSDFDGSELKKRKSALTDQEDSERRDGFEDDSPRELIQELEDSMESFTFERCSPPRLTTTIESAGEASRDSSDLDGVQTFKPSNSLEPRNEEAKTSNTSGGSRLVTVYFEDEHKSAFAVPIGSADLDCRWLIEELTRRYFRRYYIKPNLSLVTRSSGAFLCEDDRILSVIDASGSLMAKIISWKIDTADKRYNELCSTADLPADEDVEMVLKYANMSAVLRVTNMFVVSNKHVEMMFQAMCRQDIKELDISFTNTLLNRDCYRSFKAMLSSLSALEVLNLSGLAYPRSALVDLFGVSTTLRVLNLSYNSIGDEHSYTLAQIIKFCPRLEFIDLTGCDLSHQTVANRLFIASIENSSLHSVVLDCNQIDSVVIASFRNLFADRTFLRNL